MQQPPVMPQRGRAHVPFLRHHHEFPNAPDEFDVAMRSPRQAAHQPAPGAPEPAPGAPEPAPAPTPQPALSPGTILVNRYLIEGYIGGGGFAHIYRARDL